jgi:hypothetical protein
MARMNKGMDAAPPGWGISRITSGEPTFPAAFSRVEANRRKYPFPRTGAVRLDD